MSELIFEATVVVAIDLAMRASAVFNMSKMPPHSARIAAVKGAALSVLAPVVGPRTARRRRVHQGQRAEL
jgi:hypothetical protein